MNYINLVLKNDKEINELFSEEEENINTVDKLNFSTNSNKKTELLIVIRVANVVVGVAAPRTFTNTGY